MAVLYLLYLCALWAKETTSHHPLQVGPFQMHAALKLFRSCADRKGDLRLGCLQRDYVTKFTNKTISELEKLQARSMELI